MRRVPQPIRTRLIVGGAGTESYPAVSYLQPGYADVILVRDGEAYFEAGGIRYIAAPGDLMLLQARPAVRISCGATQGSQWSTFWVHFAPRPHWHALLKWPPVTVATGAGRQRVEVPGLMCLHPADDPAGRRVVRRFAALAREARLPRTGLTEDETFYRCEGLLVACRAINPLDVVHRNDPRIQRVLDYLEQHFTRPITLEHLGAIACLSPSQLERLFFRQTGLMPFHYLERLRLTRADFLLSRTNLPVGEVARSVGFENPDYFSTRFRRIFKITPRQSRGRADPRPGVERRGRREEG